MTGRNRDALHRIFVPLLFITTTLVVAGCLQQAGVGSKNPEAQPAVGLVQDPEPKRVNLTALGGGQPTDPSVSAVQVLPGGNVPVTPVALSSLQDIIGPTATRWVKNTAATTLWSGSDARAAAFTDLPADSYLRVTGPSDSGRLAVYYAGDGLLRRAGNGWVESAVVDYVDAPAPGQVPSVDADANQPLPVWVQAHKATLLWSGPDDKAVVLTDLPQWTFIKVGGLERGGRLLVNYAGDYASRQPGIGWVDQSAVGPAGDPGVWVTNHRATALWSGVDTQAVRFTDLPQWSKLRTVQGALPDASRMQIEFFGDGNTRQPGMAWVARADIGPITPPVPLPLPAVIKTQPAIQQVERYTFASGTDFIKAVGDAAQRSRQTTGVPASVTVAQAILESDWGRSRLARQGNNLFGIKALGSASGPAGVVSLATWEHVGDSDVVVQAPFKAYYTLQQSIDDHATFFTRNRRYASAMVLASDAPAFARAIQDAGYATDPSYASKLIGLMDRYNLYRFDQ